MGYTWVCANHVSGEGPGTSLAAWKASNGRTILGFNVMTPRAQDNKATRQRHFLCLETFAGKVFLKWGTQCHTWKNFELYMPEEGPTEVRTFCQVCHERQIASRMSRKNIPKKKRTLRSSLPLPEGPPPPLLRFFPSCRPPRRRVAHRAAGQRSRERGLIFKSTIIKNPTNAWTPSRPRPRRCPAFLNK